MKDERTRWEERYEQKAIDPLRAPSHFLQRHLDLLPRGRAVEIACGDGRNAIVLARHGFIVDAIDIAKTGLQRAMTIARTEALRLHAIQADLDSFALPSGRYDVAINVRFLQRRLFAPLQQCVRPGGVVLFETFISDQAQLGHPRNPAYLLAPGELRQAFADFEVVAYEEGRFETEAGPAFLARLLARRPLASIRATSR